MDMEKQIFIIVIRLFTLFCIGMTLPLNIVGEKINSHDIIPNKVI